MVASPNRCLQGPRNGGYGSVNQALSFGIPLVTAGLSEDKADVNARVTWSGVGIDLKTQEPTPSALRKAVRAVVDTERYRLRASQMAGEFTKMNTKSEFFAFCTKCPALQPKIILVPVQANPSDGGCCSADLRAIAG